MLICRVKWDFLVFVFVYICGLFFVCFSDFFNDFNNIFEGFIVKFDDYEWVCMEEGFYGREKLGLV